MPYQLEQLTQLMTTMATQDGFSPSEFEGVGVFKSSKTNEMTPSLYEPFICLAAQGEKQVNVGDSSFRYKAGQFFINFLPMPLSSQIITASPEKPFLSAALGINLVTLADMILRIERFHEIEPSAQAQDSSCVLIGEADEQLVDVFTRLILTTSKKAESQVLGASVVDELYYRVLTSQYGYALRTLLNQYGQIQPISKAVNYIHSNLNKTIQVNDLADIANMSKTSFFNAFKTLMHLPPVQYIKSTKLQRAHTLLMQGMQANEASYHVGYNSFSQFSREYKRFYGFPPSETRVN